jgi:hypothetical protein
LRAALKLTGHSSKAFPEFYEHFRKLVASAQEDKDQIIGGLGIIVEVDKPKMGKRKYHRGHIVNGVWAVAGIEPTEATKVFEVSVEDGSPNTLIGLLSKHVAVGSIFYANLWKGYSQI